MRKIMLIALMSTCSGVALAGAKCPNYPKRNG
jgi:hypothetical protein